MEYVLLGLFLFVVFFGFLFYKLSKPEWFVQFMTGKFEDKDLFTRFVKFLMA
jgi:hypothetical protein